MASLLQNPIVGMVQTQLEVSRRFADVIFSGTEKIDHVMIGATHRAFTEQLNLAQALASAHNPEGIASLQSNYFSHRPESAVNYQKEMMRIFSEIQNELGQSMQDCVEKFGENVANRTLNPLRAMQERVDETLFSPITSMLSVWESAFNEVASLANRNISVARSSYENAVNATTAASKKAMDISPPSHNGASEAPMYTSSAAPQQYTHMGEPESSEEKKPHGGGRRK